MKNLLLIIAVIMTFSMSQTFSDTRSYVWTYEYMIMEPGEAELEHYFTINSPKLSKMKGNTSIEHKFAIEVGMSKHFDFSIYQNFLQIKDNSFQYSGFDLRARFLIGNKNQFLLDPLVYLEYGANAVLSYHKFEAKLVLAKDIGKLNLSINPTFEIEYENEFELVFAYAFGSRYEFDELFRVGLEFKGNRNAHYIGTTISHGKKNLWIAASPTIILSRNPKNNPEFQFRMILGIGL